MTIINLNQMQSKQKHLKQPCATDQLSSSNLQIKLNMNTPVKEKHQPTARQKDLNAEGATSSRPSSNTRFHGQGGDPLVEEEVATPAHILPSSQLKSKDLESAQEIKNDKIVVKANNGS